MNKYIFTFGSSQLDEFAVNPNSVALIIEADTECEARTIVFNYKGIGAKFSSSYEYEDNIDMFLNQYNMVEVTLDELESLRLKPISDNSNLETMMDDMMSIIAKTYNISSDRLSSSRTIIMESLKEHSHRVVGMRVVDTSTSDDLFLLINLSNAFTWHWRVLTEENEVSGFTRVIDIISVGVLPNDVLAE